MSILVYALHYQGEFNKNSLGAVSEGAKLANEIGGEAAAVVVGEGDDLTDELCASLGRYGASKVYRARAPEGLAQPVVDVMAKVIADNGYKYALFGGGLLGFEIGAGLTARLGAGVTMEVTAVKAQDGKLVAERPILKDSQVSDVHYRSDVGVIAVSDHDTVGGVEEALAAGARLGVEQRLGGPLTLSVEGFAIDLDRDTDVQDLLDRFQVSAADVPVLICRGDAVLRSFADLLRHMTRDGVDSGHVLAILKNGETILDRTGERKETIKLPNERIGLLMVFRTFDKVSYALVMDSIRPTRVGYELKHPDAPY